MNKNFYSSLKVKVQHIPSIETDKKIIKMATAQWKRKRTSRSEFIWGVYSSAIVLLVAILINLNHSSKPISNLTMRESPEMIINYKNMELMAVADVSDEEWNKIINNQ